MSVIAGDLERAVTVALQRRARVAIHDFPVCVAPRLQRLFAAPGEAWVAADGTLESRTASGPGCPGCPGVPVCAGAPIDYVARFGWEEFADAATSELRVREDVAAQQVVPVSDTMVLSWRGPRRPAENHAPSRSPHAAG